MEPSGFLIGKNPAEINPVGFLVLATSYSRTAYRRTTIGAAAFHCRVRNGNGWDHCATVTRVRNRTGGFAACAARQADADLWGPASDTDALQFIFERTNSASSLISTYRKFSIR